MKINNSLEKALEHIIKNKQKYLVFLFIFFLLLIYLFRWINHNSTIIGTSSYFYLSAAEKISFSTFYLNPYNLFLSLNIFNNQYIYQMMQIALAIISLILLINLTKKFNLTSRNRFFFLFFLIISPTFLYLFTVFNHQSFFIFLNLLGFTFLIKDKIILKNKLLIKNIFFPKNKINLIKFSYGIFAIIPFFDLFSSIFTFSLLAIFYYYFKKEERIKTIGILIIVLSFLISGLKYFVSGVGMKQIFLLGPHHSQKILFDLFADLGSSFGISLFALLLAIMGIMVSWKKEKIHFIYLIVLLLVIFYIFQTDTLIYLNFFVVFFASFGFTYIVDRVWKINEIKGVTIFLLVLGLFFSTLICFDTLSGLQPSSEVKKSLVYLGENLSPPKIIFSHPRDSYIVEYFSNNPSFIHYSDEDFKEKMEITNTIFQSAYIGDTFPLLENNNIQYIYISPQTMEDLPTGEGLLFLFQNERFKRFYQQDNIIIQEFGRARTN